MFRWATAFILFLFSSSSLVGDDVGDRVAAAPDLDSSPRVNSPPREYFSINTLFLQDRYMIQIGHDLLNNNYVVMPSPNVTKVKILADGKKRVTIRQYFPELEQRILQNYSITPDRLHYLYISSYQVLDDSGREVKNISIPSAVHYRPPQTMQFVVHADVELLNFVFGFTGRTAWASSGVRTDLTAIFADARSIDIDRDAKIHLEVDTTEGIKAFEVFTADESQTINQILSEFQQIVTWGSMVDKEDFLSSIIDLRTYERITIDIQDAAKDFSKYPHIFGNPTDPRWKSVIHRLATQTLTEDESRSEDAFDAKFGISGVFSVGSGFRKESSERIKKLIDFEFDGELYVPKKMDFVLRAKNSLTVLKRLVYQAFDSLHEAEYFLGTGVSVSDEKEDVEITFRDVDSTGGYVNDFREPMDFSCKDGSALSGFKSLHANRHEDRRFSFQCRQILVNDEPISRLNCQKTNYLNNFDEDLFFTCGQSKVLIGEYSEFSWSHRDRRFGYECCELYSEEAKSTLRLEKCEWSDWVNKWDKPVDFHCPDNMVLKGVRSKHHNVFGDRRYQYQCCEVSL